MATQHPSIGGQIWQQVLRDQLRMLYPGIKKFAQQASEFAPQTRRCVAQVVAYQHADETEEQDTQVVVGLLQRVWMPGSSEEQCASHDGIQSYLHEAEDVNESARMTKSSLRSSQRLFPASEHTSPYITIRFQSSHCKPCSTRKELKPSLHNNLQKQSVNAARNFVYQAPR